MAQPHVPTSLDQITAEVMTDALRSSGFDEVTVSSVSAERIAIGEGFLGELARLTLDYSAGTGPATAIAKIPIASFLMVIAAPRSHEHYRMVYGRNPVCGSKMR